MVLQALNLGLQFGMETKKIKVRTLTDEGTSPKCIGFMKGEDGEFIAGLRVRIGSWILTIHIINVCYKAWMGL
jgi:hypothetical protein